LKSSSPNPKPLSKWVLQALAEEMGNVDKAEAEVLAGNVGKLPPYGVGNVSRCVTCF